MCSSHLSTSKCIIQTVAHPQKEKINKIKLIKIVLSLAPFPRNFPNEEFKGRNSPALTNPFKGSGPQMCSNQADDDS